VNPVFVLPAAAAARGPEIAAAWVASLTMGAGQFCTNPGVIVVPEAQADAFVEAARAAAADVAAQTMLSDGIAAGYRDALARARAAADVQVIHEGGCSDRAASPTLLRMDARDAIARPEAFDEVFGPAGTILSAAPGEMEVLMRAMAGQLTATLQMDEADHPQARALMPALEAMAGRILANGFPTGVEVAHAMMHGGPWPATTDPRFTSVGTLSIRRWLRPVCFQDMPEGLMTIMPA
jgi:NADP-dependent aldehyde dehydrogenase